MLLRKRARWQLIHRSFFEKNAEGGGAMSPAQPILRFGLDSYLSVVLKSIWMRIRDLSLEGLSLEEEDDAQSR